MKRTLETMATALLLAIVMILGAWYAADQANVLPWSCPSEDSCTVDYRGGRWHIVKVNP